MPEQRVVKVEEFDGCTLVSAASDLMHTARGLVLQGLPLS